MSKKSYADLKKSADTANTAKKNAKEKANASQKAFDDADDLFNTADEKLQTAINVFDKAKIAKEDADKAVAEAIDKASVLATKAASDATLAKTAGEAQKAVIDAQGVQTKKVNELTAAEQAVTEAQAEVTPLKDNADAKKIVADADKQEYEKLKKEATAANAAVSKKLIPIGVGVAAICLVGFLVTYFLMGTVEAKDPTKNNTTTISNNVTTKKHDSKSTATSKTSVTKKQTTAQPVTDQSKTINALQQQLNDLKKKLAGTAHNATTFVKKIVHPKVASKKTAPKKNISTKDAIIKVAKKNPVRQPKKQLVTKKTNNLVTAVAVIPKETVTATEVARQEDVKLQQTYQSQWDEAGKQLENDDNDR